MSDTKENVVPEDEQFLSDEELFEQAYNEKFGIKADAEEGDEAPAPEAPEGEEAPEPELAEGESAEREPEENEAAADKSEAKQEEDDLPEFLKDASDEAIAAYRAQQKELAALRNQYNAVHNRLAPVQQENARLRQRLSATPSPAQTPDSGTPVGQSQPGAGFSLDDVEEFKEFRESFPDEAKAMEAAFARQGQYVGNLETQLQAIQQGMQEMRQSSFETQRQNELAQLSEAHPDWATVNQSEDYREWLGRQPESVAALAHSTKAQDCVWVLDRYKADAYLAQQFQQEQQPKPEAGHQPSRAQQTRERRQQIRSVPNPPPQAGGLGVPQGGNPDAHLTDEQIWEQEAERRLRAQREANR